MDLLHNNPERIGSYAVQIAKTCFVLSNKKGKQSKTNTEGSCLMLLLGPGKKQH